jgi:hypothetical protein
MFQPDEDESSCVVCGGRVWSETDRAYAISPERDLCFGCSVARGGAYDEETDRWVVPPRLEPALDLKDERV